MPPKKSATAEKPRALRLPAAVPTSRLITSGRSKGQLRASALYTRGALAHRKPDLSSRKSLYVAAQKNPDYKGQVDWVQTIKLHFSSDLIVMSRTQTKDVWSQTWTITCQRCQAKITCEKVEVEPPAEAAIATLASGEPISESHQPMTSNTKKMLREAQGRHVCLMHEPRYYCDHPGTTGCLWQDGGGEPRLYSSGNFPPKWRVFRDPSMLRKHLERVHPNTAMESGVIPKKSASSPERTPNTLRAQRRISRQSNTGEAVHFSRAGFFCSRQ